MLNVIDIQSSLSCNIIKYYNIKKFKYNNYPMIIILKLLFLLTNIIKISNFFFI